jgi:hypothetical protein
MSLGGHFRENTEAHGRCSVCCLDLRRGVRARGRRGHRIDTHHQYEQRRRTSGYGGRHTRHLEPARTVPLGQRSQDMRLRPGLWPGLRPGPKPRLEPRSRPRPGMGPRPGAKPGPGPGMGARPGSGPRLGPRLGRLTGGSSARKSAPPPQRRGSSRLTSPVRACSVHGFAGDTRRSMRRASSLRRCETVESRSRMSAWAAFTRSWLRVAMAFSVAPTVRPMSVTRAPCGRWASRAARSRTVPGRRGRALRWRCPTTCRPCGIACSYPAAAARPLVIDRRRRCRPSTALTTPRRRVAAGMVPPRGSFIRP